MWNCNEIKWNITTREKNEKWFWHINRHSNHVMFSWNIVGFDHIITWPYNTKDIVVIQSKKIDQSINF
jgi:hypothetical protein